ncbi:50S ribosomal protein L19e [Candidatus Woesearchaeota archaeon]|nr:50S ribosomal protein L19e [Candidatus Woesearchaeota archaeon]
MNLQKRLAAKILKCSPSRVVFDTDKLSEIKEAITKFDIRGLINKNIIRKKQIRGISKVRARKTKLQKRKGRRKGMGSRKGKASARAQPKGVWMNSVRAQRNFLKDLKSKGLISTVEFKKLYAKSKGGFFRSVSHLKLIINEQGLIKKK